jgi:hypothetical protein
MFSRAISFPEHLHWLKAAADTSKITVPAAIG